MKTKLNINHRLLMVLLVIGSVFSMVVSSAFTTGSAWTATLAQSGGTGAAPQFRISPASLGTEDSITLTVGSIQAKDKNKDKDKNRDADNLRNTKPDSSEDNSSNSSPSSVTELSGTLGNLVVTPTRATFTVGGAGARMDASLINGFSFSNGDQVTVEGYYIGSNGAGTFLVTEIDKVP
jgi:hypothetical protein